MFAAHLFEIIIVDKDEFIYDLLLFIIKLPPYYVIIAPLIVQIYVDVSRYKLSLKFVQFSLLG